MIISFLACICFFFLFFSSLASSLILPLLLLHSSLRLLSNSPPHVILLLSSLSCSVFCFFFLRLEYFSLSRLRQNSYPTPIASNKHALDKAYVRKGWSTRVMSHYKWLLWWFQNSDEPLYKNRHFLSFNTSVQYLWEPVSCASDSHASFYTVLLPPFFSGHHFVMEMFKWSFPQRKWVWLYAGSSTPSFIG